MKMKRKDLKNILPILAEWQIVTTGLLSMTMWQKQEKLLTPCFRYNSLKYLFFCDPHSKSNRYFVILTQNQIS